ncbi:MAG TPA: SDR family oxidoreductase [Gammaproteobacteria bacterium]|nr:SDR family oxidoreductase [Gammaproteobacteria bacterium]
MSIEGKVVLVTGPTAGIGREIARALARQGADLVLGCRDLERGRRVAEELRALPAAGGIEVMQVDTSSRRSIREFANAFRAARPRLDVLVNNAGISQGERKTSVDGLELTFATNVLGYFLLTNELLPVLRAAAPARIVSVASAFASDLDLDDLQFERRDYDGMKAYAQSKACNRLWTWALARRLAGTGVTANAMTPGFVPGTELSRDMPPSIRAMFSTRSGRTPAEGADTAVWLASSPDLDGVTGKFFADRRERPCEFRDEADEERLWSICERLTAG